MLLIFTNLAFGLLLLILKKYFNKEKKAENNEIKNPRSYLEINSGAK